jgi:hypothetical protein
VAWASGAWWWFAVRWKAPPSIFDAPVNNATRPDKSKLYAITVSC